MQWGAQWNWIPKIEEIFKVDYKESCSTKNVDVQCFSIRAGTLVDRDTTGWHYAVLQPVRISLAVILYPMEGWMQP